MASQESTMKDVKILQYPLLSLVMSETKLCCAFLEGEGDSKLQS